MRGGYFQLSQVPRFQVGPLRSGLDIVSDPAFGIYWSNIFTGPVEIGFEEPTERAASVQPCRSDPGADGLVSCKLTSLRIEVRFQLQF